MQRKKPPSPSATRWPLPRAENSGRGDSHQFGDVLVSEQIDEVRNGRPGGHGDVRGAGCIVLQLPLAIVCLELGEHMSNFIRATRKNLGVVAKKCYKRAATSVNDEWLSPHKIFYGSRPPFPLLPFLQPAYHRVPRQRKTDPWARVCYFLIFGYNYGRLLPAPGCGDAEGRLFARRHLASLGNTVDHPDPGRANRTAERYLRPHAAVCARRCAISCTRRHSTSSRTGSDTTATAYTNVELPGSDLPAR